MLKLNWFNLLKIKEACSREGLDSIKCIPKVLSKTDKIVLGSAALIILLAAFFIWRGYWLRTTYEAPAFGGTLTEGIIGEAKDLDKHLARLVGAGLTRQTETGEIVGDLAESWEIMDGNKTYQFKLREGFNSQDLAYQLSSRGIWPNIEVQTPADNLIQFKFKQPFSPFLSISTEPVFDYGPYKVVKEDKNHITLLAQELYWQGSPHIEKIVINFYANEQALLNAARSHEITSFIINDRDNVNQKDYRLLEMDLPRELNLFFNLQKDALKSKTLRQSLRDNKPVDKDYNLTLVTSNAKENIQIAKNLQEQWATLKVNLEIKEYDNITLQKDVIPKREYDLLLYGLDYGPDPDPYPFWHTSQIATKDKTDGMNLSNFSNKTADQLLEQARQSFDPAIRLQKYESFQKILNDEVPYILIKKETLSYALSNKVKNIEKIFGVSEADRFLNVAKWYIKSVREKNR